MVVIEVGDKLRLNVAMVKAVQTQWGGMSLLVEVTDITNEGNGVKSLVVKTPA